jgi:hypothetical protein
MGKDEGRIWAVRKSFRFNIVNRYSLLDAMARKGYNPYSSMALEGKSMVYQTSPSRWQGMWCVAQRAPTTTTLRREKAQKNMCFCETNRIQKKLKWRLITLIIRLLQLSEECFSIRFVFPFMRGLYEVDFGL